MTPRARRPWLKLWRDEKGSFAMLSLLTRGLFDELLKFADEDGRIWIGSGDPCRALTMLCGPCDLGDRRTLGRKIQELLDDGCMRRDGEHIVFPNFAEWQHETRARTTRDSTERDANLTRTEREPDASVTRDTRETDSTRDVSTRNDSTETQGFRARAREEGEGEGDKEEEKNTEQRSAPAALELVCPPAVSEAPLTAVARRVFQHWQRTCDRANTKETPARLAMARARLREGFTEAELCLAATNVAASPWHRGENDRGKVYTDFEMIYRKAETVEKYRDLAPQKDAPGGVSPFVRLSREYRDAKQRGDARETARLLPLLNAASAARREGKAAE